MQRRQWILVSIMVAVWAAPLFANDWPVYRGSPERAGYSNEPLPGDLSLHWRYEPGHAPQPAWSGRDTRMPFDRTFHPVIAGGRLFFGNSVDCKVYALDASSGEEIWSFFCDGPVRFAPAVEGDRVFAASDDGYLYCLAASDGRLIWKVRGGPTGSRVLGNGRVISRWPARGGPVVDNGVVCFGAGIWPSEGIFIYAIDAEDGGVLWCNDRSGGIWMGQPHGGANAVSGVSAQGYFCLAGDKLLVPTGRAVPAVFDRKTGELLYFHLQKNGHVGGADVVAGDGWFLNGSAAFDLATGNRHAKVPRLSASLAAASPDGVVQWEDGEVRTLQWQEQSATDRKGSTQTAVSLEQANAVPCPFGGSALIVAGRDVVSAGSDKQGYGVAIVDRDSGECRRSSRIDSEPLGLAIADGRLLVSTATGELLCFGSRENGPSEPRVIAHARETVTFEDLDRCEQYAEGVLQVGEVTEGYCVDLGCGDGGLAYALARRTDLQIFAIDPDPANVAAARRELDAAGLYGSRVTVVQGDPAASALPDYLADLVVSGRNVNEDGAIDVRDEARRIIRPYGGVACFGRPGEMVAARRSELAGAGTWTHQYCDPTNSNCSSDTLVEGPLGVVWFNDLAFPMPSRHGRGRAPLFYEGRTFVEGLDALLCVNAYNGRKLWEYPLPGIQDVFDGEHLMGTSGTGGNLCVGDAGLYIHTGKECLRLDPASGAVLGRFKAPTQPDGEPGTWGIVALEGDTLFGTLADTRHLVTYRYLQGDMNKQFTESILLFVMDAMTGEVRWSYRPEHTIRHNAIAIGDGRVHLIDRSEALGDREREKRTGVPLPEAEHPPGRLIALDAATGQELWRRDDDIYGTTLALSAEHDVLLMCYQDWRFKLASELGGRMAAFDTDTGRRRWDIEASYQTRPVINGRTVYLQPGAWDLLTGGKLEFTLERSYGCGIPSGCTNMLVYRSAVVGYVDLEQDYGTENYGGIRPGCWINAIPAGGLVLMPDATDRCKCSYLNKASIALAPFGLRPPRITPDGASGPDPIAVRLDCDREDAAIRYTLDGTPPTADSPRYGGPLTIESTATLQAKAFADRMPPSRVATARFVVDPNVLPLDAPGWTVIDSPGGSPSASNWQRVEDYVTELSNLFVGVAGNSDSTVDRPGTYRVFAPGHSWTDGELSLEISSSDDDGLGVAFRFNGSDRHLLWSMDRQRSFRILASKQGDDYRILAQNTAGYEKNRWYSVRVVLDGRKVTVYVDGEKDLEADGVSLTEGTIALYAWGCAGAKFRNVRWIAK